MKRLLSIALGFCMCQSLPALDQVDARLAAAGFLPVAAVDAKTRQHAAATADAQVLQGLCLDAELADREGRHWSLQWKLLGDGDGLARKAGRNVWRAGVVLTAPDGQVHERIFARGAGLVGSLAAASDGWEWRSRDSSLLPAKLRFDVDGREVILLLDAHESSAAGRAQAAPRVRVRGFVNLGLEKTYLSGHGQLQRDWPQVAGRAPLHTNRSLAPLPTASE